MSSQDRQYERAAQEFGGALSRLVRGYEADPEKRRDLLQEIHLSLWRSFAGFDERCALRTWVYRVAHNTAAGWVLRQKRSRPQMLVSLEEVDVAAVDVRHDEHLALDRLTGLIRQLRPLDRQVILAWLEGLDAAGIGELTGLSSGNIATKIHRIKAILTKQFHQGVGDGTNHAG